MPFYIVQAGSSLQRVTSAGAITTLSLPSGITIDSTVRGRFAILGRRIVFVNAPTRNLVIDHEASTAQLLVPPPPPYAPTVVAGTGTGLTGAYRVRTNFKVKDAAGRVVSRSESGPASASFTAADESLAVSNIAISPDADVNCRGLERTTAGGSIYYDWIDIDDNETVAIDEALADASLQQLPASETVGMPPGSVYGGPRMKLVVEWKGRLFGVSTDPTQVDYVRYSELEQAYNWPDDNLLRIQPIGQDESGVTGFMARRDELAVGKRDRLSKIVLSGSNFAPIGVVSGIGIVAPESALVIRDVGRFLAEDGVYEYGSGGVQDITKGNVKPWFTSDDYFNRALFPNAVSWEDPILDTYNLLLAAAGSSDLDRWISLYLSGPWAGKWLGPHKTADFTPTFGALLEDSDDLALPVVASSGGFIYTMHASDRHDGTATAIDYDVDLAALHANTPDILKMFKQLSVQTKVESSGTLTVTPTVGPLTGGSAQIAISHDLTKGRELLRRLGRGEAVSLNFRNNVADEPVTLRGLDIPYHEIGRR